MSCDRNKCYKQDYNGGSCEECMKDTQHDYCCEIECGEHEFYREYQKAGGKKLVGGRITKFLTNMIRRIARGVNR